MARQQTYGLLELFHGSSSGAIAMAREIILSGFNVDATDKLEARQISTEIRVFENCDNSTDSAGGRVLVEGEWGWIEEITLTFVVVKLWDQRRLIVPITHFIEKPFQNWTRTASELDVRRKHWYY